MRPGKQEWAGEQDLFRSRLNQIINMRHELVRLGAAVDWSWIDAELAGAVSENGQPAVPTRFKIGLLLLKHIFDLSDEGVCERWGCDPYFQHFTGEESFQHAFPHERSNLSRLRGRIGDKLDRLLAESLRVAHGSGALTTDDLARVTVDSTVMPKARNCQESCADGHRGGKNGTQLWRSRRIFWTSFFQDATRRRYSAATGWSMS